MTQVRPLLSPLLVGRDDLLALAERRLGEVAAGRGHLLLLAGEAGIGKSRMVSTIKRKAAAEGFAVVQGDLAPADSQVPLASVLDLARTMRVTPGLEAVGDDLLALRGGKGADSLGSRRELVREVAARIVDAVDRPVLLSFEDLQWADELSLEVVGELARLGRELPLFLLGAYRLDELPARFAPPRVEGAPPEPAARRGGEAQAAHARRDGTRRDAHPGQPGCPPRARS